MDKVYIAWTRAAPNDPDRDVVGVFDSEELAALYGYTEEFDLIKNRPRQEVGYYVTGLVLGSGEVCNRDSGSCTLDALHNEGYYGQSAKVWVRSKSAPYFVSVIGNDEQAVIALFSQTVKDIIDGLDKLSTPAEGQTNG